MLFNASSSLSMPKVAGNPGDHVVLLACIDVH